MKCKLCRKEYSVNCDYNQGRCPNHPPLINLDSVKFLTLFRRIKSWAGGNSIKHSNN